MEDFLRLSSCSCTVFCLQLMKEPVLQDKRSEHVRFCRFAAELTERVSGKPLLMGTDVSLARLQRANVVAQSRITFSERELLVLIRNHLVAKGLQDTANTLVKEASLPAATLCPNPSPSCVTPPPSASVVPRTCRLAGGIAARIASHVGASPVSSGASVSPCPSSSRPLAPPHPSCSSASTSAHPTPPPPPLPHPSPQGQGPYPLGRILFSRERPVAPCSSGKKLRALKQKSDHGAFIQVRVRSVTSIMAVLTQTRPKLSYSFFPSLSDSSNEEAVGTPPSFPSNARQHHHRVPEGTTRPLPQPGHHMPPFLSFHAPPLPGAQAETTSLSQLHRPPGCQGAVPQIRRCGPSVSG